MTAATKRILKKPAAAIERWAEGEEIPALLPTDWLTVAEAAPHRFIWVVEPSRVLPFDEGDSAQRLWTTLAPALAKESLDIALGWLSGAGLGSDEEVARLLEERLSREAAECSWFLLCEVLEALANRGAPWRAARFLEEQLNGAGLDADETARIASTACLLMDGPLLAAMARNPLWQHDDLALARFAAAAPTASLIDNFGNTTLPQRLRLDPESSRRLQAAVWRILAARPDSAALATVGRLLTTIAAEPTTQQLATAMIGIVQHAHGEAALPTLVRVFLSGIHHSPAGEAIERWLMQSPLASLEAALDPFPEERLRFDENALRRLCFRMLPALNKEDRAELVALADLAEGRRARIVHEEL